MIYLELFWSFFQIGLCSIGGGYAAMPLIQNQVVDIHHWMDMTKFVDIITISQMTPGPIAINSATFVGLQIGGVLGAIVATIGCIVPSCIIVLVIAYFYYKYQKLTMVQGILGGLRPAVVAMIASAGISILLLSLFGSNPVSYQFCNIDVLSTVLFLASILVLRIWKINPIYVMLGAGVISLGYYLITG